ncbi:S9 family peptidase [Dyella sp. C9]|uniref:alpha/beta hydrolase family protein n=1 Tax=Dyella sp. C9 TaxID=2202154 RepID=UPI000DEF7B1D|nr:alpha/beta hydrolase [Dyella sp. C9]
MIHPAIPASSSKPSTLLFPGDEQFWFETVRMFGADEYGGASFGEVLAVSTRIAAGDYDGWYDAWNAMAERIAAEADGQIARNHRISARDNYLRASNYYRASEFFLHATPQDPRVRHAYECSAACYRAAAALHDPEIRPVEIPYEGTRLPGYFHTAGEGVRPLLIMHTGFDGSAEEMHWSGARAAVERGYHALCFDGPGQFGPLHREGLVFRPDWENVVTPVVDFALTLPGVDPSRIALRGESLGGYLAPRAAAFEHRLAAVIANDGLYDYGAPHVGRLPEAAREALVAGQKTGPVPAIDQAMEAAMKTSPVMRWAMTHGMWCFGAATPSEYMRKTLDYTLAGGIAEQIRCPVLVCDAGDDLFFKGQPQQLYDHLTCKKALMIFTEAEGAGFHCEVGAARLANARMFDWLDETLGM